MLSLFSTPKLEDVVRDVNTLLKQSKAGEALSLIEKAAKKNIYHADLFLMCSRAHALQQDAEKQRDALERYIRENEKDVLHHLKAVEDLIKDKNYVLTQSILDQTKKRFPLSSFPHAAQAKLCCAQEQYEEAAKALLQKQQYGKLEDSDIDVVHQIKRQLRTGKTSLNGSAKELFESEQVKEILRRDSFRHFVSLGTDCEFGQIQWHTAGITIPSLFKGSHMPLNDMVRFFKQRPDDFASQEKCNISYTIDATNGKSEYWFKETEFNFAGHAGNSKITIDANEPEEQTHKRIRETFSLLSRKMLEDLEDENRIFVYKSREIISIDLCKELLSSLCTIGNNKLLVVMLEQPDKPTFEEVQPNLVIGRMNAWWQDNLDKTEIQTECIKRWNFLISKAYDHFKTYFPEMNLP